jgi:hypothetical protein
MMRTGCVLTENVYPDDVEKRGQVIDSNHPETVAMLGHSMYT